VCLIGVISIMRIAIVAGPNIPVPPVQYGGTEQVIYHLINGLLESGHEPILLGPPESKVDCRVVPIVESALYYPPTSAVLSEHKKLERASFVNTAKELNKLLPEIDIIHSHGFDMLPFKHFPNVTTIHHMIEFFHVDYFEKRKQLNYISISKSQQETFPELNYVSTVYNGEDPSEFPLIIEPEDYVCFLGRFDRDKNPHLAIELAISIGIKIKIAGKIDYKGEDYFKDEIQKYIDHPLVEYLGELGFKDKVKLLSGAKCNLHPTNFREPFGLTVLEAAYCGTPTLATARGSMPELIEPDRTGMLVEDFIEGRHVIDKCFKMDRKYIASRSRQLFNFRTMARDYVAAYETVINATPKPSSNYGHFSRLLNLFKK
jgi:glycosyltransferase involved in cell wall biosynthesis